MPGRGEEKIPTERGQNDPKLGGNESRKETKMRRKNSSWKKIFNFIAKRRVEGEGDGRNKNKPEGIPKGREMPRIRGMRRPSGVKSDEKETKKTEKEAQRR